MLLLQLAGTLGVVPCVASRGDSARVMNDVTSGGKAIRLPRRSFGSGIGDGRKVAGGVSSVCEAGAELLMSGTCSVGLGDFSSRSELCRRICGTSGRSPSPTALDELGIRFPLTGSNPAAASLVFALSRSDRSRSLSALRWAD